MCALSIAPFIPNAMRRKSSAVSIVTAVILVRLRVEIVDQIPTDRVINEFMGKHPSARFKFIMERAGEAEKLDV